MVSFHKSFAKLAKFTQICQTEKFTRIKTMRLVSLVSTRQDYNARETAMLLKTRFI